MLHSSTVRRIVFWIGCLALVLFTSESLAAQTTPSLYYYYQGARIPLQQSARLLAVRFRPDVSTEARRNALGAAGAAESFDARIESPINGIVWLSLRDGTNPVNVAEQLRRGTGVLSVSLVYEGAGGQFAETDEFLVRFKADLSAAEIDRINQSNGAVMDRSQPFSDRVLVLKPTNDNPRTARELANAYVEGGWVDFAEPNFVIRMPTPQTRAPQVTETTPVTPNDEFFRLQWALRNTGQFLGAIPGADINAINAWGVTKGATAITIAIIDEGVNDAHPDLASQVLIGYNALDGSSNTTPKPNDYHGTATAGIAAASSNNGLGIAGVCWFCQILPVKIAERDAQGNWNTTTSIVAAGIDWAWQNGADVLNGSWTMPMPDEDVELSIFNARFAGRGGLGSTLVFAAGNEDDTPVPYPASLNTYVIAVGASNWCDQRKTPSDNGCNNFNTAWGSNFGSALDLVAPGESIYTTCNGNECTGGQYTYFVGTSASTPLVAGAVGLLYSLNPNLSPEQVQSALEIGARDIGVGGPDGDTGFGRLDTYKSIAALYEIGVSVSGDPALVRPGDTIAYTIQYANTGMTAMGSTVLGVTLPVGTTYVSSSPPFAPQGDGVYQLALGKLASNRKDKATFRIKPTQANAGNTLSFNVTIGGAFPELNTANNFASTTTLVTKRDYFLPFLRYQRKP